jgi:hypothetical protein
MLQIQETIGVSSNVIWKSKETFALMVEWPTASSNGSCRPTNQGHSPFLRDRKQSGLWELDGSDLFALLLSILKIIFETFFSFWRGDSLNVSQITLPLAYLIFLDFLGFHKIV